MVSAAANQLTGPRTLEVLVNGDADKSVLVYGDFSAILEDFHGSKEQLRLGAVTAIDDYQS